MALMMQGVGESLVETGAPMVNGTSIVDDGSSATALELGGYSILQADSMAEARKLIEGHPHLSEGKGEYSIEVYELAPVPMDA